MLQKTVAVILTSSMLAFAQQPARMQLMRQPVRGVHGAVAAGSEYATEAGMRTYYRGGNAVDAGVAAMFATDCAAMIPP